MENNYQEKKKKKNLREVENRNYKSKQNKMEIMEELK